jgi:hypothetical protein
LEVEYRGADKGQYRVWYVSLVMVRRWLVFGVCKGKRIRAVSPDREGEARS